MESVQQKKAPSIQRLALNAAMDAVHARYRETHPEIEATGTVMTMQVINNVGMIIGENDDAASLATLYEFLKIAIKNEGALIIALDRLNKFFFRKLRNLEDREIPWSVYQHTTTSVRAMHLTTS